MDKLIDKYNVMFENHEFPIEIRGPNEKYPQSYIINFEKISEPILKVVDRIKERLAYLLRVDDNKFLQEKMSRINMIREEALKLIDKDIIGIDEKTKNYIIVKLIMDSGLGPIQIMIQDDLLEEVMIMPHGDYVRVYHRKYGMLSSNVTIGTEDQVYNYSSKIARLVGEDVNRLRPLLDAHLSSGDRVNIVCSPISDRGSTITIRKYRRDPWTVIDLIKNNTCSTEIFSLIWLALEYEMSIIISGGTSTGKTSFLNAILMFIKKDNRLVSIEDTREISIPENMHWIPLVTRRPNTEGIGGISMYDLIINSLRMRPDRIILGEIRRNKDAEALFEAMTTGHAVYSTLHASTLSDTVRRLVYPPIALNPNQLRDVGLNIVMFRNRRLNIRRVAQIGEFDIKIEDDKTAVNPRELFGWDPINDKFYKKPFEDATVFNDLVKFTGQDKNWMMEDMKKRKKIIDWMVKNNLRSFTQFSNVMEEYYQDKEKLLKKVL